MAMFRVSDTTADGSRSPRKRRKIRCQLGIENATACLNCLGRGVTCVVQQAQREDDVSDGSRFNEKLGRIELLLEKLIQNGISFAPGALPSPNEVNQRSKPNEPAPSIASQPSAKGNENSSVLLQNQNPHSGDGQPREQSNATNWKRSRHLEEIRQDLSNLLPSQTDADLIGAATNSWALARILCTPADDLFKNHDPLSSFNLTAVSNRHPTIIARTLLYIAICIQQLPPEFNATQLGLTPSLDATMEKYVSAVMTHITSDDELASTIEGLECLLLQGFLQLNSGNLRRAWLSFRRALTIAQLICMDKDFRKSRNGIDSPSVKAGKQMWHQVVMSDRYVSLLMGLPCGTGDDCFGPKEPVGNVHEEIDLIFERRLSIIAGHLSNRNQAQSSQTFSQTQMIDEDMERLANEMPHSWWDIPQLESKSRSSEVAQQFSRLTTQMWYYQLQTLLHLPFMLNAATEIRYQYSKGSCSNASREVLLRYLALRRANNTQLLCRVVDFAAFISGLTIILSFLLPSHINGNTRSQNIADEMTLLEETILSMEKLARSSDREVVAKQSVEVLRALLRVNETPTMSNGHLRLTVPYFGIISIIQTSSIQSLEQVKDKPHLEGVNAESSNLSVQDSQAIPPQSVDGYSYEASSLSSSSLFSPVVSFSSTQFPWLAPEPSTENGEWQNGEIFFFDSLVSSDVGTFDAI